MPLAWTGSLTFLGGQACGAAGSLKARVGADSQFGGGDHSPHSTRIREAVSDRQSFPLVASPPPPPHETRVRTRRSPAGLRGATPPPPTRRVARARSTVRRSWGRTDCQQPSSTDLSRQPPDAQRLQHQEGQQWTNPVERNRHDEMGLQLPVAAWRTLPKGTSSDAVPLAVYRRRSTMLTATALPITSIPATRPELRPAGGGQPRSRAAHRRDKNRPPSSNHTFDRH